MDRSQRENRRKGNKKLCEAKHTAKLTKILFATLNTQQAISLALAAQRAASCLRLKPIR